MRRLYIVLLVIPLLVIALAEHRLSSHLHGIRPAAVAANHTMLSIFSPRGIHKRVLLPDGSSVWLNAESTLSYPADMANGDRTVEVFGEAFFDIVANPSRPFRVHARDICIQVLGTRFAVRDYPDEEASRTIVTAGAVKVNYLADSIILYPGQQIDVDPTKLNTASFLARSNVDTTLANSWTDGVLTYRNIDLRSLLKDLSRAYNVDLQVIGPVSDHLYGGSLPLNAPLGEVLKQIIRSYGHASIDSLNNQRWVITVIK